jgi:acyl-CoA thioesterase-2
VPQDAVDDLVKLLDLEAIEVNIFRGISPDEDRQRIFGGQVAGQALVAAARTVEPERQVHSLHAYFLRAGDPRLPVLYDVDRIRDGGSFTTRPRPIDIRHVDWPAPDGTRSREPRQNVWLRADGRLPQDPILHTIVLTYASDMTLLDTATLAHGGTWFDPTVFMASLDHAMWFHRPFRADDWLLYAQDSPNATGGRGLSRGLVFTRDGTLVATVMQEGLIRTVR